MGGGGVQRVTKFVKYLDPLGWRVTVLCGRADDYWMRDETLQRDVPASARVLHTHGASGLGLLRRLRGRGLGDRRSSRGFAWLRRLAAWTLVPDSYIGWKPFAMRAAEALWREDPPEVLLSSSPPDSNHVVALELKRRTGLPWLADFRDPWIGLHLHAPPSTWHRKRQETLERQVLAEADCVVATTTWLRDLLRRRGPAGKQVHVIRNGYDPEDFQEPPAEAPQQGALHLAHTGMLTLSRSAAGLLRALDLLQRRRPELRGQLELELIGARESSNDGLVQELQLQHCVSLQGYVPHAEAIRAMQRADVLVLIKHDDRRYEGLIPGKFYEYLGAGRPILGLVPESEAAQLIRELACGEIAAPDETEDIVAALERLLAAKRDGRLATDYACAAPARFQRPEQTRNLASLLDLLLEAKHGRRP